MTSTTTSEDNILLTRIAPKSKGEHWRVRDYLAIDFTTEEGWQQAIDIFEDRIRGRFLQSVSSIDSSDATRHTGGFAIMAIDCLLIETLEQFRIGELYTPQGVMAEYFRNFLTQTSFNETHLFGTDNTDRGLAHAFQAQVRNGILHQAETKAGTRIVTDKNEPLVRWTKNRKSLVINRRKFHDQLVDVFEAYLRELRNSANLDARSKFKWKMDHICRINRPAGNKHLVNTELYYFAYGSNMKTVRLQERAPSAQPVSRAQLLNYRLSCNKQSRDGSGKANLEEANGSRVWGVLYRIAAPDAGALDEIEQGYDRYYLEVQNDTSKKKVNALTYISTEITAEPVPYDWYKNLLLEGAQEHRLPRTYIGPLRNLRSKPDPNQKS